MLNRYSILKLEHISLAMEKDMLANGEPLSFPQLLLIIIEAVLIFPFHNALFPIHNT